MNYIIKKHDIYDVTIAIYETLLNNQLVLAMIPDKMKYRKAIYINNSLIDLENGEEILFLHIEEDYISPPVFENRMYVLEMTQSKNISDEELIHASNVYRNYLHKKNLEKQRKIIPFPSKRII